MGQMAIAAMQGMSKPQIMNLMMQMMNMPDTSWGKGGHKGGKAPDGSPICSVHGKKRSIQSVDSDGMGGYMCKPGMECQVGAGGCGGGMAKGSGVPRGGAMICSVHGKKRSLQSLDADGMGGLQCKPGMECQMGAGAEGGENNMCSVHGKTRSAQNLEDDGVGGFKCIAGMECQYGQKDGAEALGQAVCETHGKNRSMQSLEDDGMGGYRCKPGFECKTGGKGGGGGRYTP